MKLKNIYLIVFIMLYGILHSQPHQDKDFVVFKNGDTVYNQIKEISTYYIKVISSDIKHKQKTRKIKADSLDILYSTLYGKFFEVHDFGKKKKKMKIIGRVEVREIVIFCFLEDLMAHNSNGDSYASGLKFFGNESYFRLAKESRDILHKTNIEELKKVNDFICLGLMQRLLNGLSELDLGARSATSLKDELLKYNSECEAQKTIEQEEKNK